jgi:hypothetical protein
MTRAADEGDLFEKSRPQLLGIAYRMVGTMTDAGDLEAPAFISHVDDRPPRLDDLAIFVAIDGDAHHRATRGENAGPAGRDTIAIGELVLHREPERRIPATHRGDRSLHTREPIGAVGIIRVVVHDVGRDELVEPRQGGLG